MNRNLSATFILSIFFLTSCYDFLEENPKGFLSTSGYYQNKSQVDAAVYGLYDGLDEYLVGAFGVAESPAWALEYITGFCSRPNTGNNDDYQFLNLSGIDIQNGYIERYWKNAGYYPIENCNSFIEMVPSLTFLTDNEKNTYMGQAYFLRAYYYFLLVKLYGDIPVKTTPTTNLNNLHWPKSSVKDVYAQIVKDLEAAEACNLKWTDPTGKVNQGAIKSLLAKVYITMAGYPLQGGKEYYDKAYLKSKEVIASKEFMLFKNYSDLRKAVNENYDEHIFMFQKLQEKNENIIHFSFLPAAQRISILTGNIGGAMKPLVEFYNSYKDGDKRKAEQVFFYTSYPRKNGGTQTFEPYIFKFWDDEAEISGRSGANAWCIRYADILLLCAEAKAMSDGGSTADDTAVQAYYDVRKRAFSSDSKPASITFDQVYKERTWELCFEFQAWFDIQRTRKIYDFVNDQVVDVIGYKSPGHVNAFSEKDMLFPIPYSETIQNPLLLEEVNN